MPNLLGKLKGVFKRGKKEEVLLEEEDTEVEDFLTMPRLTERTEKLLRSNMRPVDLYPLYQPWTYAHIVEDLKTGKLIYLVEEVSLNEKEAEVFRDIVDYITWELEPPKKTGIDTREYIMAYARKALRLFQIKLGRTPGLSWSKIGYYIERDLLGYGILDPIFRDENIEDISCNGPGKPVYVWHRKYESLPTNIVFKTEEELDEYVLKLAHMAGKHISVAYPILDAILPGGHRVAATFQKEVSTSGSTFTVRKFREDPITIIDMINFGTISPEVAAYFWLAMDYKMTSLILGVTGAGKSVSGKTKILAIVKGVPGVFTIDEIWNELKDDAIQLANGFEIIYKPDVLVRTCNPVTFKCVWKKPRAFIKHRNDKRMFRIKLRSGRYVDVTEDHSIIVVRDGKFVETRPREDIIGLYAPASVNEFPDFNVSLKSVLSLLKGKHTYAVLNDELRALLRKAVAQLGQEKVLAILGYKSSSSIRTQKRMRLDKVKSLLSKMNKYPKELLVSDRTGKPVPLHDIVKRAEFAELLGLYVAEGFSDKHFVAIAMSDPNTVIRLCKVLGGEFYVKKSKNRVPVVVIKGVLASLIRDCGAGDRAENKRIPRLYWIMPRRWKAAFFRGYISGDGYVGRKELEMTSASENLAWDILFALSELGVFSRISKRVINGKTYFRVFIPKTFYKVLVNLGIIPHYKTPTYYDSSALYEWTKYDNIPSDLLLYNPRTRKELQEISKQGLGLVMLRFYEGKAISRHALAKLIEKSGIDKEHVCALTQLLEGSIAFDKITAIEEIEPEEYVYDFEIPETENFEANNIIVHNTSTLNALANLLRPTYKVVTIEDTPELRLPQENWVQLVSRPSYLAGGGIGEITLFHLVKVSLRYRPDVIVVGEVRGEEAYVLFQAIASVSWDTPVLIKDLDGNASLVSIGEFIDSFYREGEERIAKEINGYFVLSHEGFRTVWKPIKYVLRHSTDEIYVIRYEGGGELKATGSHSVFVLDPESLEIIEKPVKELKPGELLVTFVRFGSEDKERSYPTIDVIEEVGDSERDFVDNVPAYIVDKVKKNPIRLATYLRLEQEKSHRTQLMLRRWRSNVMIPAVITLDEDLAFVFGAYLADGSVYRRKGSVLIFSFGKSEKQLIAKKVRRIMKEKFGIEPYVQDRGTYVMFFYNNTLLAELFAKIIGRTRQVKKIPQAMWEAPTSVVKAFFEGLKADARRTLKRRYTSYTTSSLNLAQQLVWLARINGFYASLHAEKGIGKNIGKTYYTVNIYFNTSYRKPNTSEKIPTKVILKLIEKSRAKSMPFRLTYIKRRKYLSKTKVNEILEWIMRKGELTPEAKDLVTKVKNFMNGNLIVAEIREILKKPYKGYVYDISVPNTESFFGGNVPVLLHNTGHSGLTTLHAENIDAAVKRLTSAPMNIPPAYIPLVNMALVIKRIIMHKEGGRPRPVRRITNVWEIRDYNEYQEVARWDPVRDRFDLDLSRSVILEKIGEMTGRSRDELIEEIARRKAILEWLSANMIRSYREVAAYVQKYYMDPRKVLKEIGVG